MNSEAYQSEGCVRLSLDITQLHSNQDSKEFYTFKAQKQNLKFELLYRDSGAAICGVYFIRSSYPGTCGGTCGGTRDAIYVHFRMSMLKHFFSSQWTTRTCLV